MPHEDRIRCPACSGKAVFDMKACALVCSVCAKVLDAGIRPEAHDAGTGNGDNASRKPEAGFYECPSCHIMMSPGVLRVSEACPCCGELLSPETRRAPNIAADAGVPAPDIILPFARDSACFAADLRSKAKQRFFVPDKIIKGIAPENIQVLYLPYWLFDIGISGDGDFLQEDIEIIDSGKSRVYLHHVYKGRAGGAQFYAGAPVSRATAVDNRICEAIEPFDLAQGRSFSASWLPGLAAMVPAPNAQERYARALKRVSGAFDSYLSAADDFNYVRFSKRNYEIKPRLVRSGLFPVMYASVRWGGRTYRFAMNGETGTSYEEFPVSSWKLWLSQICPWFLSFGVTLWLLRDYITKLEDVILWALVPFVLAIVLARFVACKYLFPTNLLTALCGGSMLLAGSWLIYDFFAARPPIGEGFATILIFTVIGFLITLGWVYQMTRKDSNSKDAKYYSDCSYCAVVSENRADFRECVPDYDDSTLDPDSVILHR